MRALGAPGLLLLLLLLCGVCAGEQHNALEAWASSAPAVHRPDAAFSLSVSATLLARSGDEVNVSWAGVPSPSALDFVAWRLEGDGEGAPDPAPSKFQLAGGSPSGVLSFRLLNQRSPGRFVYYTGSVRAPVALASSPAVSFADYDEPTAVRLSLTGVDGELRVSWTTRIASAPAVRWGREPDALTSAAAAETRTYGRGDLCAGGPATGVGWLDPGSLHSAVMTGLTPGEAFFYHVYDAAGGPGAGGGIETALAPPAGGGDSARLLVVADLGQAEADGSNDDIDIGRASERSYWSMAASRDTVARMAGDVRDGGRQLLLHNGDISYARGYGTLWDTFFDQIGPVARRVAYMTAIGCVGK